MVASRSRLVAEEQLHGLKPIAAADDRVAAVGRDGECPEPVVQVRDGVQAVQEWLHGREPGWDVRDRSHATPGLHLPELHPVPYPLLVLQVADRRQVPPVRGESGARTVGHAYRSMSKSRMISLVAMSRMATTPNLLRWGGT